jgi:predicted nucleotidyltransferase
MMIDQKEFVKNMDFIKQISSFFFVNKIILYGSRAISDHHDRSDIDLAIDCKNAQANDWIKINSILKKLNFDKFNVHLYQGNIRIFIEAVLWKLRTGAPWRDLPSEFGPYSSIFNRFNRWSKIGLWKELFNNANSV